jgi:hypothetical protein
VVRRRSVTPKLILENVLAKHDIELAAMVPRRMVLTFSTGISEVRFPKPICWPICVTIASARRKIYTSDIRRLFIFGARQGKMEGGELTHERIRI